MLGNHFDTVRQSFADQFEKEGTAFLYRKGVRSAPIRVTKLERDKFIVIFQRRLRYASWSVLAATFLLIVSLIIFIPGGHSSSASVAINVGIAAILAAFMITFYWAWNAPARELERRPLVGEARTQEEVRQIAFAKMTYGQLGSAVGAALLLVWKASAKNDGLRGWGVLWLVVAGALIIGAAVQAFRKWMYERG